MDRRHFLKHIAAISATSLFSTYLPRICAWGQQGEARPHFFMFVFARGGWDPTMVFEPKVGLETIDVDPEGDVNQINGITFLDNPNREMVRTFFQDFGDRTCVINGVNTQSVSHSVGTEIMMTGTAGMNSPDWPTMIVTEKTTDELIPYMALSGPSFSGTFGTGTASGSGFLNLLLSGGNGVDATTEMRMDAHVTARFNRYLEQISLEDHTGSRSSEVEEALSRWKELKDVKTELGQEFNNLNGLENQGVALASAFSRGYALTGSLAAPGSWDSHSGNYGRQSPAFENTFRDLHSIVTYLGEKNATSGPGTLLDQTTIVVMSEMGRTPKLNGAAGKDHWSTTSIMVVGGFVNGGRVVGGTDDSQIALRVNYSTGILDETGEEIRPINVGAALLESAGVSPSTFLTEPVTPFRAFLT